MTTWVHELNHFGARIAFKSVEGYQAFVEASKRSSDRLDAHETACRKARGAYAKGLAAGREQVFDEIRDLRNFLTVCRDAQEDATERELTLTQGQLHILWCLNFSEHFRMNPNHDRDFHYAFQTTAAKESAVTAKLRVEEDRIADTLKEPSVVYLQET